MRPLLLLASAIVFFDTVFYSAITPLLPKYTEEFGLSKSGAGILAAAYPAGTLLAALPGGWLAARVGVRPTVLVGLGLTAISSLVFAFAPSIALLDLARFVQGVGGAASWAGAMGWLIGAAPADRRGALIGTAMAAAIAGALLGPVLGAVAATLGPEVVFSGVSVICAGLAVWAARTPASRPRGTAMHRLLVAARDRRVSTAMWLVALPGLLFGTLGVLGPLKLDDLGAGAAVIAAVWLGGAALEATVSPIAGRIADRRGRILPALGGISATTVLLLCLPWADSLWLFGPLVLLCAPAVGTLWAPAMAMLADSAERHGIEQGFAFALMNLAWASGQTAGASLGARLADAVGDEIPYLLLAATCAASFVVLARRRAAERSPVPAPA